MRKTARLIPVLCAALVILFFFASCFLEDLFDPDPVLEAPVIEGSHFEGSWNGWHIDIWWSWLDDIDAYEVHRACPDLGVEFQSVGYWGMDGAWTDSGYGLPGDELIPGNTYQYKVRGHFYDGGFGPFSEVLSVTLPAFLPPENLTATLLADGSAVMVDWDPVDEADRYVVYRSEDLDGYYNDVKTTTDTLFLDTTIVPPTIYYYKVLAYSYWYGDTDFCDVVWIDTGAAITSSWADLGSAGFASTARDVELASVSGVLYALFADANDAENRIKAMTHDGSDAGSWFSAGDYLSLGAADGDKVTALAEGGNLYAAYADTDVSVASGDSPRIFVKQYSGTTWSPVGSGSLDGVSTYDTDVSSEMGAYGAVPALAISGIDLFMVYQTDSFLVVDSLSYPGSGDYWIEEDSDYWITPTMISAFDTALATNSFGQPVAALQSGGTPNVPVVNLYRYDGSSWAPVGTEFDDGSGPGQMYIRGFVLDSSDVPYLAFETLSSGGVNIDVSMWTGAVWQSLNLTAELTAVDTVMDLAIIESPSGTGIYSAVVFLDTDGVFKTELWEYAGSNWLRKGSSIDSVVRITRVALALDSSSRPVLIFAEGTSGALHAKGYRE